jgi:hypothetical protein
MKLMKMLLSKLFSLSWWWLFLLPSMTSAAGHVNKYFNRVSTYYVCSQIDPTCNTDEETVAEIIYATTDGMKLLYTNGPQESIGFIDISDFTNPVGLGELPLEGEPTSVAVVNDLYAVAGVNTAIDFVNVTGQAVVIDIEAMEIVRTIEIGGKYRREKRLFRKTVVDPCHISQVAIHCDLPSAVYNPL